MKTKKIILVFLAFVVFLGVWSVLVEPNFIKITRINLEIKNLPPAWEGVEIAHLSDFHSKRFGKRESKILKILDELSPDFVFITGDIVDWQTKDFDSCQSFWRELAQRYPERIFGVLGNHDYKNLRAKNIKELLERAGIDVLLNESMQLKRVSFNSETSGGELSLIGVDDPHLGFDDLDKAMEGVKGKGLKILLAHSPEIFRKLKGRDIDLVLVGHTHAGQINIPILRDFIMPLKYDKKYYRGLFQENSTYLYVSRGIGCTFLPIRFNSFPEVVLIKLHIDNL